MTLAELRAAMTRHRRQGFVTVLSLVVLAIAVTMGAGAKRQLAPAKITNSRLHQSMNEIDAFRAAFKAAAPVEDARLVLPDSLDVSVPHDLRMSMAGQLATRAERAGLSNVRVRFAPADSAAPPPRPDFLGRTVTVGDYTIALDCEGGFAALLSFVNHVPAATALQRIIASRSAKGVSYHLVFTVLEGDASADGQHG